jgi:hypothetical protein
MHIKLDALRTALDGFSKCVPAVFQGLGAGTAVCYDFHRDVNPPELDQ